MTPTRTYSLGRCLRVAGSATGLALGAVLAGCAVVTVTSAAVSVAGTAVNVATTTAGLAVDAAAGTVRLAGRAASAVIPGGD
jgi:hypothetical protein